MTTTENMSHVASCWDVCAGKSSIMGGKGLRTGIQIDFSGCKHFSEGKTTFKEHNCLLNNRKSKNRLLVGVASAARRPDGEHKVSYMIIIPSANESTPKRLIAAKTNLQKKTAQMQFALEKNAKKTKQRQYPNHKKSCKTAKKNQHGACFPLPGTHVLSKLLRKGRINMHFPPNQNKGLVDVPQ